MVNISCSSCEFIFILYISEAYVCVSKELAHLDQMCSLKVLVLRT